MTYTSALAQNDPPIHAKSEPLNLPAGPRLNDYHFNGDDKSPWQIPEKNPAVYVAAGFCRMFG